MRNVENKSQYLNLKRKAYYGGAALITLLSATLPSYGMDNQQNDEIASCHVRLGKLYLKSIDHTENEALAFGHFKSAALSKGTSPQSGEGWYYLGLMHFKGQGADKPDLKAAFDNFKVAAAKNHPKALFRLGIMNQFGIGTKQNYTEARGLYEKSYEKPGVTAASYFLGNLYKQGLGGEQSTEKALQLWEKAAESVHRNAAYKVAKAYSQAWDKGENKLFPQKVRLFLEKLGGAPADELYLLEFMESRGLAFPQRSAIDRMNLYIHAAKSGYAHALFKLGEFYESTFEEGDQVKAFTFYEDAAEKGDIDARRTLIERYSIGKWAPKDAARIEFYLDTLDKNIAQASFTTRKKLLENEDTKTKALQWFEKKASKGHPYAQHYLGKLLEEGKLLGQDIRRAISLYQEAARQGKRSAQRRLDDFKQVYLFEALRGQSYKNHSLLITDAGHNFSQDNSEKADLSIRSIINAPESAEGSIVSTKPVNNGPRIGLLEEYSDKEKKKAIEVQESLNALKISRYLNAIEKHNADGNDELAKHLEERIQGELAWQDDFKLALTIDKNQ